MEPLGIKGVPMRNLVRSLLIRPPWAGWLKESFPKGLWFFFGILVVSLMVALGLSALSVHYDNETRRSCRAIFGTEMPTPETASLYDAEKRQASEKLKPLKGLALKKALAVFDDCFNPDRIRPHDDFRGL